MISISNLDTMMIQAENLTPTRFDEIQSLYLRLQASNLKKTQEYTDAQIIALVACLAYVFRGNDDLFAPFKKILEERTFWHVLRTADTVQRVLNADKLEILSQYFSTDEANIFRLIGDEFESIFRVHDIISGHRDVFDSVKDEA